MFTSIESMPLPEQSKLDSCHKEPGAKIRDVHTDCFSLSIRKTISIEDYVEAFYTSWLFKVERVILGFVVAKPSTDTQASELSMGKREQFSAWNLEYRDESQVVLADFMGKTKSWLMIQNKGEACTQLFFGSAVMPRYNSDGSLGKPSLFFRLMGGFHILYSRSLLWAASRNLISQEKRRNLGSE